MKTILTSFFCFLNFVIFAQENILEFDKMFYESEDHWVAFPPKEGENKYMYGFIYLDNTAGYTFHFGGNFSVDAKGKFTSEEKRAATRMIRRLEPNTMKMAIIPDAKLKELELPKVPDWLEIYKSDETAETLTRKGYHLNHIGASKNAVPVLLKAYKMSPHEKGLEFELSYAYNAIGEFQKAVEVLEKALKNNANDPMFYRELGYSFINLEKPLEAEKIYKIGISILKDDSQKAEMAYNMAVVYYQSKEKSKFEVWAKQVKKFAKPESQYAKNIILREDELK
ncbi:tetratricopeptide repeat protein [Flavobacterium macacae]|uniref:Uncharacterized protein n=1 Tax=Flavobacterium macacae TaxID=2488993 RepID=A0A3P3WCM7_9FLAO|nr:tetratricopeptide repeat protein [Flavobacterium macacae]RRJ91399.1 hypothetical protein EG849_08370 [Flavobacterium macacae]